MLQTIRLNESTLFLTLIALFTENIVTQYVKLDINKKYCSVQHIRIVRLLKLVVHMIRNLTCSIRMPNIFGRNENNLPKMQNIVKTKENK